MTKNIKISAHALEQFTSRTSVSTYEACTLLRKSYDNAELITKEEAYQINGDKKILNKYNKKSKYYKIDFSKIDIKEINNTLIGIFVIRDNEIVTFKTNKEIYIYQSLNNFYKLNGVYKAL